MSPPPIKGALGFLCTRLRHETISFLFPSFDFFKAKVQSHIQISLPCPPFIQFGLPLHQIGKSILEENVCISFCVSTFSLSHTHTHTKINLIIHERNRELHLALSPLLGYYFLELTYFKLI